MSAPAAIVTVLTALVFLAGLVLTSVGAIASHVRVKDPVSEAGLAWLALVLSTAALVLQITSA